MTIYPALQGITGRVLQYKADSVHTTVNGKVVCVGVDYEGSSRMAVIRQAVGNAFVRQWRAQLSGKFKVSA